MTPLDRVIRVKHDTSAGHATGRVEPPAELRATMRTLVEASRLIADDLPAQVAALTTDPARAAALTITLTSALIDYALWSSGVHRMDDPGVLMLSARSLMIDQVAYRLLENAGGAP